MYKKTSKKDLNVFFWFLPYDLSLLLPFPLSQDVDLNYVKYFFTPFSERKKRGEQKTLMSFWWGFVEMTVVLTGRVFLSIRKKKKAYGKVKEKLYHMEIRCNICFHKKLLPCRTITYRMCSTLHSVTSTRSNHTAAYFFSAALVFFLFPSKDQLIHLPCTLQLM